MLHLKLLLMSSLNKTESGVFMWDFLVPSGSPFQNLVRKIKGNK